MRNVIIAICAVVLLGISTLTICGCSNTVVDAPTDLEAPTDETEIVAEMPTKAENQDEAGALAEENTFTKTEDTAEEEATAEENTPAEEEEIVEEEVPEELVILCVNDVSPAEIALIIDGEKFRNEVFRADTIYESNVNYAVEIDGERYAPMKDSFRYRSVAELKEALLEYYTVEFIDETPFFNQKVAKKYGTPAYYKDYHGKLYKWDEGDYFGEFGDNHLWNSEASFKTVSRKDGTVVIEFSIYLKPMYSGNIHCTRHFTINNGRISAVEHTADYEPNIEDFEGSWAGYNKDGEFVQGYAFFSDKEVDYKWYEGGSAVVYYAGGAIVNCDRHSYYEGIISFGSNNVDSLWVHTFSHTGGTLQEFTASTLQYDHDYNRLPAPKLSYKRVNSISVVDGKVVIK